MFLAVIGDIMGNIQGLKDVLDAIDEEGIVRVVHTGNIGCDHPNGAACLELLRKRSVICVRGLQDDLWLHGLKKPLNPMAFRVPNKNLRAFSCEDIEYIKSLPRKTAFVEENLRIVVCHGALNQKNRFLSHSTPRVFYERQREIDPADIIISGGATDPHVCRVANTLFVVPGSLSLSNSTFRYMRINAEDKPYSAHVVMIH